MRANILEKLKWSKGHVLHLKALNYFRSDPEYNTRIPRIIRQADVSQEFHQHLGKKL